MTLHFINMESLEIMIKIILGTILIFAGLLFWLIPKLKISKKLVMNDKVYILTQIIGIFSGIVGLFITFIYTKSIIELHLWELIVMPYVIIQVYWLVVERIRRTDKIVDEKQDYDMTKSAGITLGLSIPAMVLIFILYENQILSGIIWFPYYLFVTILFFSSSILFLFKWK